MRCGLGRPRPACGGGALSLGAGAHTLTAATPGTFAVTDLSLTSRSADGTAAGAGRAVSVRSWQPDQRQVSIGPGAASYLEVHESYNRGWAAALNGRQLTPVRLDGWQQGFVVPAGPGGTIALTFRPAATYHLVLIATILGVAVLLALAVWSFTGSPAASRRGAAPTGLRSDEGATREGGASKRPGGERRKQSPRAWLGVLGVTALIFVAGGPVAIVVPFLAWRAWRLPVVAFGAMAASGLLAAVRPFGTGLLGPFGWPAQACALVALAAALTPAVAVPAWRRAAQRPAEAVGEENR